MEVPWQYDTMTSKKAGVTVAAPEVKASTRDGKDLHLARRGDDAGSSEYEESEIQGFDAERMRARTLLSAAEEKKLLRRIDWVSAFANLKAPAVLTLHSILCRSARLCSS